MAQLKNTIIRGGLSVLGETRLNDQLFINGNITHNGSTLMNGNLEIIGDLTLHNISSFLIEKDIGIHGNATIDGTLVVSSSSTTLKALNATTGAFSSNVTVSGTLTSSGNLTVNGATTTVKALNATNGAFSGTLGVSGAATFASNVTINGNLTVNGTNTVVDTTTLSTKDLLIELGKGNTTALTNYAGFYVTKYDGTNSGAMIIDKDGNFYVGDVTVSNGLISSTTNVKPIAIRGTTIANALTYWNSDKELICSNNIGISGNGIIAQQFYGQATSAASANYAGMEFDTYSGNTAYSVPIITGSSLANTKKALAIAAKGITINPSTGVVSATTFSGTFSGNATSATTAQSATTADTATQAVSLGTDAGSSTVPVYFSGGKPVATSTTLAVSITGNAATATYASRAVTTSKQTGSYHLTMVSASTSDTDGADLLVSNSKALTYNVSSGVLSATTFSGAFSGNATSATSAGYTAKVSATSSTGKNYIIGAVSIGSSQSILANANVYVTGGNTVVATTFSGAFSGNATSATSATSATKSTQVAITGKNTGVYNLGLISSSTTTTTGAIYGSSTNALTYDTSLSQLNIKNAGIQYNSTDECIEFIIS